MLISRRFRLWSASVGTALLITSVAACESDSQGSSANGKDDTSASTAVGSEGTTKYPLTIQDNCGRDVVIEKAPQRAVSLNQGTTEVLLSLGLEDRMVGTATWTDEIRENLAAANAKVPRLADNSPSFERVLKEEPDVVTASFEGSLQDGEPDRRDQYEKIGVPTYIAPSHCDGRTDSTGDGPRDHPLEMTVIYQEIRELAEIFDVQERGEKLVAELEGRMEKAAENAPDSDVSIAFWFANTELPYMAGCCGSSGVISRTVGVENVFADTTTEWPQVSWETVVDRNPTVLVLGDLQRKSQTGDKLDDKIKFLESNAATKEMDAVKNKRYIILNGADMNPSLRTVDGTEKLAQGLVDLGLTER